MKNPEFKKPECAKILPVNPKLHELDSIFEELNVEVKSGIGTCINSSSLKCSCNTSQPRCGQCSL